MQNILFTSCKMIQFTCYIICSVSDNLIGELFYIVLEEKILSVEVIALFSANPFPYENEPYLNEFRSYTPLGCTYSQDVPNSSEVPSTRQFGDDLRTKVWQTKAYFI